MRANDQSAVQKRRQTFSREVSPKADDEIVRKNRYSGGERQVPDYDYETRISRSGRAKVTIVTKCDMIAVFD